MVKLALLIGIGDYPKGIFKSYKPLKGPQNDVERLSYVLRDEFGFEFMGNTPYHLNLKRSEILDRMERLKQEIKNKDGSTVLFYYSGHGYQIREKKGDSPPDELKDKKDEALVPLDAEYILDDELFQYTQELHQAADDLHLVFIIDACHSGTILRKKIYKRDADTTLVSRIAPDRVKPIEALPATHPKRGTSGWLSDQDVPPSYILLAACKDNQLAVERKFEETEEKTTFGVYTYFLVNELLHMHQIGKDWSYQDLQSRVRKNVISLYSDQVPDIEGASHLQVFKGDW